MSAAERNSFQDHPRITVIIDEGDFEAERIGKLTKRIVGRHTGATGQMVRSGELTYRGGETFTGEPARLNVSVSGSKQRVRYTTGSYFTGGELRGSVTLSRNGVRITRSFEFRKSPPEAIEISFPSGKPDSSVQFLPMALEVYETTLDSLLIAVYGTKPE